MEGLPSLRVLPYLPLLVVLPLMPLLPSLPPMPLIVPSSVAKTVALESSSLGKYSFRRAYPKTSMMLKIGVIMLWHNDYMFWDRLHLYLC
jgi:hypothetical protein